VCVCSQEEEEERAARSTQQRARACSLALSLLRLALLGFSQDRSAHSRRDRERGRTDAGWLLSSSALLSKGAPHAGVGENKRRRARTTAAAGSHPGASPSSSLSLFSPSSFGRSEEGSEGRQVARVGGGAGAHGRQAPHQGCPPIPPPRQLPAAPPLSFLPPSHAERAGPPLSTGELARAPQGRAWRSFFPRPLSRELGAGRQPRPPGLARARARARARERAKARGMGDAGYPPRPVGIGWKRNTRSKREPQRGGPSGPAFTPRKAARGV